MRARIGAVLAHHLLGEKDSLCTGDPWDHGHCSCYRCGRRQSSSLLLVCLHLVSHTRCDRIEGSGPLPRPIREHAIPSARILPSCLHTIRSRIRNAVNVQSFSMLPCRLMLHRLCRLWLRLAFRHLAARNRLISRNLGHRHHYIIVVYCASRCHMLLSILHRRCRAGNGRLLLGDPEPFRRDRSG